MLKKLAYASLPVFLIACSGAEAPNAKSSVETVTETVTSASEMAEVKTKAVLIYADWCGSCKVLDPKIEKVKSMGGVPGVDFVVLDYTNKDAETFYAQASEAGVEEAVRTYLEGTIKTGQLLLVDMDDQEIRGKVTKEFDSAAILESIKTAVAAS